MTAQEILSILPHRYPFLLVDKIIEYEAGRRIVGLKNVTCNEPYFPGHFPGQPVMPGVLQLEVMAQVGAILALKDAEGERRRMVYLTGVDKAKFRKPVFPGDQLRVEVELLKHKAAFWKMQGRIVIQAALVCEAEMTAVVTDEPTS
ncbi:MAG: 3-hydroxyacyl-ACP dehydratase FabZ [Nitrospira sp.]|nr:3-hydroxyacyl-ACP dehydratase FabZ [Nitrospira sp.]